jgi:hypothetical protein
MSEFALFYGRITVGYKVSSVFEKFVKYREKMNGIVIS